MLRCPHLLSGFALAAGIASAAAAQSPYAQPVYASPYGPQSDADQLAQQMRLVAANPTDLYALIAAARMSLKVGDTDAAAALYTRADRINPQQPQVKAGMARLLVQAGRPGEALRRFQEAERLGASLADFGPDRGLAYDLVGEQQRAQREYRALLRLSADDETTRRYALSLGISGLKEPALALLEPLNRRGDRGAWRARAFVLAMTGDRSGAERIANTMMPPGMGQGLDPFFDRLPHLGASERAFAVNFGETRASPTRSADARLTPSLPALSPEPDPFPKARAQVEVAAARDDGKKKRKSKKDRAEPVRFAATQPYVAPLPPPPAPTAAQLASLNAVRTAPGSFMPAPQQGVRVLPPPPEAYRGPAIQVAPASIEAGDEPDFAVAAVSALAGGKAPAAAPATVTATPAPPPVGVATVAPAPRSFFGVPNAQTSSFKLAGPVTSPVTAVSQPGFSGPAAVSPAVASPAATALNAVAASVPPDPVAMAAKDTPPDAGPAAPPPVAVAAITPATGAPPAPVGARGDSVLAAIVAGITIPDSEREAASVQPTVAPPPPQLLANVEKKAETERARTAAKPELEPDDRAMPRKDARGRFVDAKGKPLLDPRGRPLGPKAAAVWQAAQTAAEPEPALPRKDARGRFVDAKGKPLLDSRGRPLGPKAAAAWQVAQADTKPTDKPERAEKLDPKLPGKDARGRFVDTKGKPLLDARGRPLDAKAAAAWKAAQAKEPADAKKKPESAKDEPQRYWVQVAGGANEATLTKAWRGVSGQAPSLKGKQGWTTPLRATNRVLTGPFKSSGEAMAMVNQLKKEGVSAFMFTSDAGQKVTRLGD